MRRTFVIGLALAAATLGTVPMAQAQMAGQQMDDHHPGDDHRGNRPMPGDHRDHGPGQPGMVSRDQSMRLRSTIGDLNNQITRAHQDRRLSQGEFLGFQREIRSLQGQYWAKMDNGMTRGEYGSVNESIARLRTQLQRTVAQNSHRPH